MQVAAAGAWLWALTGAPAASPAECWGCRNAHSVQSLSSGCSMDSLRLPAFCGTASPSQLWWEAFLPAGIQLLSPSSGQRGLDVALPTLLVEAGSGGYCGQRWPSPRGGLDRGWRRQRNAKLWQNFLYKASPRCL